MKYRKRLPRPKRKRYFFSRGYACYEARFLIPEEFMDSFRKVWDFKKSDKMPFIHWDYSTVKDNK